MFKIQVEKSESVKPLPKKNKSKNESDNNTNKLGADGGNDIIL